MRLPNFICVGAQKAGTTTLYHLLNQHPDICLPQKKETHFFLNGTDKYSQGLKWYSSRFFDTCPQNTVVGEISPGYMYMPYVPERIFSDVGPDVKLIFMLRNPIERAYSGYLMTKRIAAETLDFPEAISKEQERIHMNEHFQRIYSYANRGLYAKQIERYLEFFPIENMFFIVLETDFKENIQKTLSHLCTFLEVSPYEFNTNIKSNPALEPKKKMLMYFLYSHHLITLRKVLKYLLPFTKIRHKIKYKLSRMNLKKVESREPIDPKTKKIMHDFFYEDIQKLERLIQRDLSHWVSKKESYTS